MTPRNISSSVGVAAVALFIGLGIQYALAQWSPAPSTPPSSNASAPINVGTGLQSKAGALQLLGQGVASGTSTLDVEGVGYMSGLIVRNLQVLSGTIASGSVLTSDASGDATWQAASSTTGGGTIVYINPVTLATIPDTAAVPWRTISLSQYGVPSTASAVILATEIHGGQYSNQGIYERANSSGQTYELAHVVSNGSGGPSGGSFNQSIYPVSMSGSSVSIDYEADGNNPGSIITLVGYITGGGYNVAYPLTGVTSITAGNNVTISPSGGTGNVTINASSNIVASGTVGGGCYSNGTEYKFTIWGNAVGSNGQSGSAGSGGSTCTCPSAYTKQQIDNASLEADSYMCIAN